VDWDKGLSEEQAKVIKPVSTISKIAIEKACIAFRNAALGTEGDESQLENEVENVTVYEHTDFPGKLNKWLLDKMDSRIEQCRQVCK
jgi:alkylated DNA repair protein alkB family protein 1